MQDPQMQPPPPPPPGYPGQPGYSGQPPVVSQEERSMAMLSYLLGLVASWIGPLIIFLVKKDQSKFVGFHAAQALLIQIAAFVLILPIYILGMFLCFPLVLLPVVGVGALVMKVIACMAANRGEWYEFPVLGGIARSWAGV